MGYWSPTVVWAMQASFILLAWTALKVTETTISHNPKATDKLRKRFPLGDA